MNHLGAGLPKLRIVGNGDTVISKGTNNLVESKGGRSKKIKFCQV